MTSMWFSSSVGKRAIGAAEGAIGRCDCVEVGLELIREITAGQTKQHGATFR